MNKLEILARAVELVLMRHGIHEEDLDNSYGVAVTVTENLDNVSGVATALELAIIAHCSEPKEGTYDDAEYLIALAKAMN